MRMARLVIILLVLLPATYPVAGYVVGVDVGGIGIIGVGDVDGDGAYEILTPNTVYDRYGRPEKTWRAELWNADWDLDGYTETIAYIDGWLEIYNTTGLEARLQTPPEIDVLYHQLLRIAGLVLYNGQYVGGDGETTIDPYTGTPATLINGTLYIAGRYVADLPTDLVLLGNTNETAILSNGYNTYVAGVDGEIYVHPIPAERVEAVLSDGYIVSTDTALYLVRRGEARILMLGEVVYRDGETLYVADGEALYSLRIPGATASIVMNQPVSAYHPLGIWVADGRLYIETGLEEPFLRLWTVPAYPEPNGTLTVYSEYGGGNITYIVETPYTAYATDQAPINISITRVGTYRVTAVLTHPLGELRRSVSYTLEPLPPTYVVEGYVGEDSYTIRLNSSVEARCIVRMESHNWERRYRTDGGVLIVDIPHKPHSGRDRVVLDCQPESEWYQPYTAELVLWQELDTSYSLVISPDTGTAVITTSPATELTVYVDGGEIYRGVGETHEFQLLNGTARYRAVAQPLTEGYRQLEIVFQATVSTEPPPTDYAGEHYVEERVKTVKETETVEVEVVKPDIPLTLVALGIGGAVGYAVATTIYKARHTKRYGGEAHEI